MKIHQKLAIATTSAVLSYAAMNILTPAQAAQFSFNYSFPGINPNDQAVTASGFLTTTDLDPQTGTYTITGISGTRNGQQIISLLPPYSYGVNDNLLNATEPFLTFNGFTYKVSGLGDDGLGDVNVHYTLTGDYTEDTTYPIVVDFGPFIVSPGAGPNVTPVPEPDFNLGITIIAGSIIAWSLRQKNSII